MLTKAEFLPVETEQAGRRRLRHLFCVTHEPDAPDTALASVLCLQGFGEELNRSRRTLTEFARLAADQGMRSCILDLSGSGDSEGQLVDSSWAGWRAEIDAVSAVLRERHDTPLFGLAIRAAALLIERTAIFDALLYWAPVDNGERYLRQWLRQLTVADDAHAHEAAKQRIENGEIAQINGYALPAAIYQPLRASRLPADTARDGVPTAALRPGEDEPMFWALPDSPPAHAFLKQSVEWLAAQQRHADAL